MEVQEAKDEALRLAREVKRELRYQFVSANSMADELGVSRNTLGAYLNGKNTHSIPLHIFLYIADVLGYKVKIESAKEVLYDKETDA